MKKIMVIVIFIGLLIVSRNALAFSFRGIEIGKSLDEQMSKCVEGTFPYPKMCWIGIMSDPKKNEYSIDGLPSIDIGSNVEVKTIDGKVECITMDFSYSNADKFLAMLKAKYGEPIIEKSVIKNRMGTSFDKITATWKIEDCELIFTDKFNRIDSGILLILSKKYKAIWNAKEEKTIKEAADKL